MYGANTIYEGKTIHFDVNFFTSSTKIFVHVTTINSPAFSLEQSQCTVYMDQSKYVLQKLLGYEYTVSLN